MSDDKKNIFDSATVIMTTPKAKEQTVSKVVETKSFIKNQETITDMANLTITETENVPSKLEKLKHFNPRNHPKLFGIVAGIVVVLLVHFLMPAGDDKVPASEGGPKPPTQHQEAQPAKVETETPPETASVRPPVQQPVAQQTQSMVQNSGSMPRYPATSHFLKELEAGMRKSAGK